MIIILIILHHWTKMESEVLYFLNLLIDVFMFQQQFIDPHLCSSFQRLKLESFSLINLAHMIREFRL